MKKLILLAVFVILSNQFLLAQKKSYATISGTTTTLINDDSVRVTMHTLGIPFDDEIFYTCPVKDHNFKVSFPMGTEPVVISVTFFEKIKTYKNANRLMQIELANYILEQKDNLIITEKDGDVKFSGYGAKRFSILQHLYGILPEMQKNIDFSNPKHTGRYFRAMDTAFVAQMKYLAQNRSNFADNAYALAEAEIIGGNMFKYVFPRVFRNEEQTVAFDSVRTYTDHLSGKYFAPGYFNNRSIVRSSSTYASGLRTKYIYSNFDSLKLAFDPLRCFDYMANTYSGPIRERMLLNEIYYDRELANDIKKQVNNALSIVKDPLFRQKLELIKRQRIPGSAAFDFALPDSTGKIRHFSEFKGKVVLIDFWFTGCGGCLSVAPKLKKVEEHFLGQPVVFLTINVDKTKETWMKYLRKQTYTSKYSADLFTNGQAFNSEIAQYYALFSAPVLILIDKDGRLAVNPDITNMENYSAGLIQAIDRELGK